MKGTIKILNLYACLGGNRKLWDEVAKMGNFTIEVTAIELDSELARMYKEMYPNDKVITTDAHKYLLEHYNEYNFIWGSPPCPSHSKSRFARRNSTIPLYPDMKLYQEIIFLDKWFKGKWVIENVTPYYTPLIPAKKRGRHLYWTNFNLPSDLKERKVSIMEGKNEMKRWCKFHDIDLSSYKGKQSKIKIARNLVDYEAGRTIFETAMGVIRQENTKQLTIKY